MDEQRDKDKEQLEVKAAAALGAAEALRKELEGGRRGAARDRRGAARRRAR